MTIYLTCSPLLCLSDQKEALVNERFPVNPLHMEELWGLDCKASLRLAQQAQGKDNRDQADSVTTRKADLPRRLQLCGFIYNTPDRQNYQPCPDYLAWRQWYLKQGSMPAKCKH